jgi:hypothetical protein
MLALLPSHHVVIFATVVVLPTHFVVFAVII